MGASKFNFVAAKMALLPINIPSLRVVVRARAGVSLFSSYISRSSSISQLWPRLRGETERREWWNRMRGANSKRGEEGRVETPNHVYKFKA